MRDLRIRKQLLGLLQELSVGRFAAERDPIELHGGDHRTVARSDQAAQERGRGGQDRHVFVDTRLGHEVGIARGGHHEPAGREERLEPHLQAGPAGGVVDEQPAAAVPLLGQPRSGEERIPRVIDELGRAARAARGHHHLRRHGFKLAPRARCGGGGQHERIVERHPVAQFAHEVAGVFGKECHRHVLPPAGRGDHHERFDALGPGHDPHGPRGGELAFELRDGGGERGIVDHTAGFAAGIGDDRRAIGKLAGDEGNGRGEPVFGRGVGEVGDRGGVGGGGHGVFGRGEFKAEE